MPTDSARRLPLPPRRPLAAPELLADDVVIAQRIPLADLQRLYGHHERACIGFEHENKNVRRTQAHLKRNVSWAGQAKQLVIKG